MKFIRLRYRSCFLHKRLLILFVFLILCFFSAYSQSVSAATDCNKILLGEQVTLQLKAEGINTRTSSLQNWFNIYDSSGHIQIVKKESIDTVELNGLTTYLQKVTITSFDSGKWKLDPMQIILQDRVTGKKNRLQTGIVPVEVLPVDVSDLQNYHDIKDIIDVTAEPDYLWYIAIIVTVIILSILTWLFIKRKKNKKHNPSKITYKGTALENALQQIKQLQRESLTSKGQVKLFYTKLSDIARNYFNEQLQIRSSQSTSDELMVLLSVYLQNEPDKTNFYQLLRLSDAVKFAKYNPVEEQNSYAVQTTITSLQHIDVLVQGMKQQYA